MKNRIEFRQDAGIRWDAADALANGEIKKRKRLTPHTMAEMARREMIERLSRSSQKPVTPAAAYECFSEIEGTKAAAARKRMLQRKGLVK